MKYYVIETIDDFDVQKHYNLLPPSRKKKVDSLFYKKDKNFSVYEYFVIKKELNLSDGQDFEYSPNGRPFVRGKDDFSISNSTVLCIVFFGEKIGGVDAEYVRKYDKSFARMICNEKELNQIEKAVDKDFEFTKLFTMKEATLKCIDRRLDVDLKNIISNDLSYVTKKHVTKDGKTLVISICEKEKTP